MPSPSNPQAEDLQALETAVQWRQQGHAVVLATGLSTWGSAPRRAGSHLVIKEDGVFWGSVSGGCVEGAVIQAALEIMGSGTGKMLDFGVTSEDAWDVGIACGGQITVWIEDIQ